MRGERGEKQKKLAALWEKFFENLTKGTQNNYEKTVNTLKDFNFGTDRVVPVQHELNVGQENIIPAESLEKILEKEEIIGLATCYCRHQKDMIDDPCKRTDDREICVVLDKAAKFLIEHGFARPISKEEALKVLRKAEGDGLVHKVFHESLDKNRGLDGICSCCPCCCGIFAMYHRGAIPAMSYSTNLAKVDEDSCIGCGTCVEICPIQVIDLENAIATVNEERCIGCGLCSLNCPEEAISLDKTEQRLVFIPPPKISN